MDLQKKNRHQGSLKSFDNSFPDSPECTKRPRAVDIQLPKSGEGVGRSQRGTVGQGGESYLLAVGRNLSSERANSQM